MSWARDGLFPHCPGIWGWSDHVQPIKKWFCGVPCSQNCGRICFPKPKTISDSKNTCRFMRHWLMALSKGCFQPFWKKSCISSTLPCLSGGWTTKSVSSVTPHSCVLSHTCLSQELVTLSCKHRGQWVICHCNQCWGTFLPCQGHVISAQWEPSGQGHTVAQYEHVQLIVQCTVEVCLHQSGRLCG